MEALAPASAALSHMPRIDCTPEQARALSCGMALAVGDRINGPKHEGSWAQALGPDGELIAVGKVSRDGDATLFHPKKVLSASGGHR